MIQFNKQLWCDTSDTGHRFAVGRRNGSGGFDTAFYINMQPVTSAVTSGISPKTIPLVLPTGKTAPASMNSYVRQLIKNALKQILDEIPDYDIDANRIGPVHTMDRSQWLDEPPVNRWVRIFTANPSGTTGSSTSYAYTADTSKHANQVTLQNYSETLNQAFRFVPSGEPNKYYMEAKRSTHCTGGYCSMSNNNKANGILQFGVGGSSNKFTLVNWNSHTCIAAPNGFDLNPKSGNAIDHFLTTYSHENNNVVKFEIISEEIITPTWELSEQIMELIKDMYGEPPTISGPVVAVQFKESPPEYIKTFVWMNKDFDQLYGHIYQPGELDGMTLTPDQLQGEPVIKLKNEFMVKSWVAVDPVDVGGSYMFRVNDYITSNNISNYSLLGLVDIGDGSLGMSELYNVAETKWSGKGKSRIIVK